VKRNDESEEVPFGILKKLAYSPTQFAKLFGRSPAWGYRRIYAGEVGAMEIAGRAMISRDEIVRFMAERKTFQGRPTKEK
jgi:hypothetical protein